MIRLRGDGEPCFIKNCSRPVTGALVDDETGEGRPVCDYHTVPIIADQEGLRIVKFASEGE